MKKFLAINRDQWRREHEKKILLHLYGDPGGCDADGYSISARCRHDKIAAHFLTYISVEAPVAIDDWTLDVGANSYTGSRTATIASNWDSTHVGNILLQVSDARTGFVALMVPGRMTSETDPDAAEYQLENPLKVRSDTPQVSLSSTDQTIYELAAPGRDQPPVYFDQDVTYTDYAADYHMIITFTGTLSL